MTIDLQNNSIWNIPPYTFWVGVGVMVSLVAFWGLLYFNGIRIRKQYLVYFIGAFGVLLGARLFGCLKNLLLTYYNHEPLSNEIIKKSGLVYYGGLMGFLLFSSIGIKLIYRKYDGELMNLIAITIPLFHGFGRIGCLLGGCCFGVDYTGPLAVTYLYGSQKASSCFPIQAVESLFEFLIFAVLIILSKNKKLNLLKIYLAIYAGLRFVLEFVRGDVIRGIFWKLSFSQYISILVFISLLFLEIKKSSRRILNENC